MSLVKLSVKTKNNTSILVSGLKVNCIQNIINCTESVNKNDVKISKIILFGSSLEQRCTESSDIDIAVFTRYRKSDLYKKSWYISFLENIYKYDMSQEYDIIDIKDGYTDNSIILQEIGKGKVIYESV